MIAVLENISKSFGAHEVLDNISVQINENNRIGLIGANGAGKSTLLNILNKDLQPDTGRVIYASGKTFGFLRQNNGLNDQNSIKQEMRSVFAWLDDIWDEMKSLEKMMSELDPEGQKYTEVSSRYATLQSQYDLGEGYQIEAKIATVLNGMGFKDTDWSTMINVLSGGEKTRLAICKLLLESPDLLILDEPTNHLDFPTLLWLENYLDSYKGSLLIVSHDRFFLDRICTTIWEVENHGLEEYVGNYSQYLTLKDERQNSRQRDYDLQQQEIEKLEDFVARNLARASTSRRAQSRQKTLEKMEKLDKPAAPPRPPNIRFEIKREPVSDVLMVEDLALSVGENPRVELFNNLDLHVKRGEKIAIVGENGIGKSSFLKAALGKIPHDSGDIRWGRNTDISYFEQGEGEMHPKKQAIDEVWDEFPRESENTIRSMLGRAAITGDEVYKRVGDLSGGEKARLKFTKLMLRKGNVLLLDEPTNHLDLPTKEVLDKALEEYEGTLLVVSHDRYLLNKFPDRIVEMYDDGAQSYLGNYDDYSAEKEKQKQKQADIKAEQKKKDAEQDQEDSIQNSYRTREQRRVDAERRKRFSELEKEIEQLEQEIEQLELEIQDPEIAADYQLVAEKGTILEQKKLKLNTNLEEWVELGAL